MTTVYSVSQITTYIKNIFNRDNNLRYLSVKGEVSNCKYHSAGHIYFTLKDSNGQLSCVMFAGKRAGLTFTLKEGQSIIVTGSITVYERDGKYQMYADYIEQEGKGKLFEEFEALKAKLYSEGLFDNSHKRPIPTYIKTLGIITAATGAALQDILNITRRRNPYVKCFLYPAKVQGIGAAATLISGIKRMEELKPDVIILGRGGGSFEDLFEFNDEALAYAIYDCTVPIISAVGHEVDYTIADFVSDLRAPTPSAAAELAVYEYNVLNAAFIDYHSALYRAMCLKIQNARIQSEQYKLKINAVSPRSRITGYRMKTASICDCLDNIMKARLTNDKHKLSIYIQQLRRLSPLDKLEQGYSYVTNTEGHNIKSVAELSSGDLLNIRMLDGSITATVQHIN